MKKNKSGTKSRSGLISARKKIYVTGDSWSAGEWDTSMGDDINLHAVQYSLSNYLGETRKYEVVHNPFPGHGDGVVIAHLFDRHDLADFDYIVYVKTCATRSFKYLEEEKHPMFHKEKNILTKICWMNDNFYRHFTEIGHKLILLGGIEKIRSSFDCFLKIPSITEFLYPNWKDTEYFGDIKYIADLADDDKIGSELLFKCAKRKIDFWKKHDEYFYPDGVHPNRKAHKKLAQFIDDYIDKHG